MRLAFWEVWVEGRTTMVHSEVLVGSHMILQSALISLVWDLLSPLPKTCPSPSSL